MTQSPTMDTLSVARDARLEGRLEQEAEILATVEVEFEHREISDADILNRMPFRKELADINGRINELQRQQATDVPFLRAGPIRGINWSYCWVDEPQTPRQRYGEIGGSLIGPLRVVRGPSMRLGRVRQ